MKAIVVAPLRNQPAQRSLARPTRPSFRIIRGAAPALCGLLTASVAALGQDRPEVVQTPGEITIHMNGAAGATSGVHVSTGMVHFVGAQSIGGEPIKGAPYSAEAITESTQILSDGNRISTSRSSMQYRDGLGRERREETLMMGPGAQAPTPKIILISDPVANANFTLNPQERTAQKMPTVLSRSGGGVQFVETRNTVGQPVNIGGLAVSSRMILNGQPDATTLKTEDLGSKLIEGVLVTGTRMIHTIPAGQVGNQQPIQVIGETWFSPELGITVMTRHSDPREGETVYRLTHIVRAEPDPALFQVPADYRIVEPGSFAVAVPKE